jgi:hypothetical protein
MKACCKTGDEQVPGKGTVWLKRMMYLVIILVLTMVIIKQINF